MQTVRIKMHIRTYFRKEYVAITHSSKHLKHLKHSKTLANKPKSLDDA